MAQTRLDEVIHLAKSGQRVKACEALREMLALQPKNETAWLWLSAISASQPEAENALKQIRQINPAHPRLPKAEAWLAERFGTGPASQERKIAKNPTIPTKPVATMAATAHRPENPAKHPTTPTGPVATGIGSSSKSFPIKPLPVMAGLPVIASLGPRAGERRFVEFLKQLPAAPALKNFFRSFNVLAFSSVILAVLAGLTILFLGLVWEMWGLALASEPAMGPESHHNSAHHNEAPAVSKEMEEEMEKLGEAPVTLKKAQSEQDWSRAVAVLEKLYQLKPESAAVKQQLAEARYQRGLGLRSRGLIEDALANFERAVEVFPEEAQFHRELELASTYVTAIDHYQAGQWQAALEGLEAVRAEDSAYPNLEDLLFSAYYNQALALEAAGELAQAKADLEAALRLHPEQSAARRLLAEIEFALAPQTPLERPISMTPIEDRAIVVSIAEQRMVVYEGDKEVFDFVVSTGEPGRDTAIGEFEILNKIEMAYASTWNLDMPYWLGIYWAGPLQNGIHSLPIVKHTGYKLWDGYLGQRVSYGCVILSDEDAAKLYDWAEVGTKVKIVPSLASWSSDD